MDPITFGNTLYRWRHRRGLTQSRCGILLRVPWRSIGETERGRPCKRQSELLQKMAFLDTMDPILVDRTPLRLEGRPRQLREAPLLPVAGGTRTPVATSQALAAPPLQEPPPVPSPAGYIIAGPARVIYGIGHTLVTAWADAKQTVIWAQITLLDDNAAPPASGGSWMRRSDLTPYLATAALIDAVEAHGGAIPWHVQDNVAAPFAS